MDWDPHWNTEPSNVHYTDSWGVSETSPLHLHV